MRVTETMSEPHRLVAAEVRAQMARAHLSQNALATNLGVSQPYVSRRIAGQVPFDVADLVKIADMLGVPLARFTSVIDERQVAA